jgi:hypothetical protein
MILMDTWKRWKSTNKRQTIQLSWHTRLLGEKPIRMEAEKLGIETTRADVVESERNLKKVLEYLNLSTLPPIQGKL